MRLLLDECLPRKLKRGFPEHEVRTVAEMGWLGTKNGALLTRAAALFDVFVTADRNLQYQQPTQCYDLIIMVLVAPRNRLQDLLPLMPEANERLSKASAGEVVVVPSTAE